MSILKINKRYLTQMRTLSDNKNESSHGIKLPAAENPFSRTARLLKTDLKKVGSYIGFGEKKQTLINDTVEMKDSEHLSNYSHEKQFQSHCDVLVIGGGGIGSSVAFWLKKRARNGLHVVVAEKDNSVSNLTKNIFLNFFL